MSKAEAFDLSGIFKKDARKLNEVVKNKVIDVTITSPPYYNLKDYGYKEQIGFGQGYHDYLKDLQIVFKNVYDCTKSKGTLWVIIDSFRQNNEVTPLPFDFSNAIKSTGWKLQEVIIWVKDKTVPWTHKGQMRSLFEYVLLFSKNKNYNFFIDKIKEVDSLKKWWVKYPERYNPRGKTPDGLWRYEIPVQGSWGQGYIRHFCPLPEKLIERILLLSTKEGGLVLDPFAGSGAVLAKADNMNRKYLGFELNPAYIKMFKEYQKHTAAQKKAEYLEGTKKSIPQNKFNSLILDLRALKFARVLLTKLPENQSAKIQKLFVGKVSEKSDRKHVHQIITYFFYIPNVQDKQKLLEKLTEISKQPPLSKFGIEPKFKLETNLKRFVRLCNTTKVYTYTKRVTHKYKNQVLLEETVNHKAEDLILSKIKVDLVENDYE